MAQKKKTTSPSNKKKAEARTSRRSTRKSTSKKSTPRRSTPRKTTRSKKTGPKFSIDLPQKMIIVGIGIIFITAVLVLSLLSPNQGQLTNALAGLIGRTFGWGSAFVPLITGTIGLYLVLWGMDQAPKLPTYRLVGVGSLFLIFVSFASLTMLLLDNGLNDVWTIAETEQGGGYFGGLLVYTLTRSIGTLGTVFTLMLVGMVATVLASGISRHDVALFFKQAASWRPPAREEKPTQPPPLADRDIPINPARNQTAVDDEKDAPAIATAVATPTKEEPEEKPKRSRRSRRKKEPEPTPELGETAPSPVFLGQNRPGTYNWKLPVVADLLESGTDQDTNNATIREQVEIIEHTLESFGAPATVVEINQGPTITQFGVEPLFLEQRSGKRTKVKVGKIAGLADDLALALAAQSIRMQAPVPGKGYVGIEVPNPEKALVSLRDVIETRDFQNIKSPLKIGLGQNVAGQPIIAKLDAMPHLLIAGTTGSGKSVCVNGIIACLLLQNTPDDLKLVMVDPKRVELTGYNGIPHLAAPVVVEMDRVIGTLQWALREMDNRYKMFADIGARNLIEFNKKVVKSEKYDRLPYVVIIIDELADLMMLSPEETERSITRLAQMARATGIHMVIATQRPSVDVVTGIIKANFPARIAFAVASSTDSRVILDSTGAERLLGQGDMLFQSPDAATPLRLQGCFVSDGELQKLIAYWQAARSFNMIPAQDSIRPREEAGQDGTPLPPIIREQAREAPPEEVKPSTYQPTTTEPTRPVAPPPELFNDDGTRKTENKAKKETAVPPPQSNLAVPLQQPLWEELQREAELEKNADELLPDVIALVRELDRASTSLLQRRFRIGYTRAARLIDTLEDMGIIGPPTGTSKAREVYPADGGENGEETTAVAPPNESKP